MYIFAACLDQHWIPFWLSPKEHALHCHTFHFHDVDTSGIDAALFEMAADLGTGLCHSQGPHSDP